MKGLGNAEAVVNSGALLHKKALCVVRVYCGTKDMGPMHVSHYKTPINNVSTCSSGNLVIR